MSGYPSYPSENLAILYYENPAGIVSALLHQFVGEDQWLDITSQDSKSLPKDFINVDPENSHTLWESTEQFGGHIRLSTPFTSGANFSGKDIGTLFYAPDSSSLMSNIYQIGLQGPGNFSGCMRSVSSYPEWFLAS